MSNEEFANVTIEPKEPKELRILMIGLDNSGKTTILYKLKLGTAENTVPTVGFNVETIKYKNILINAWDIGGQERLRALWRHYFSGTDILVFVIDSNDLDRLEKAKFEMFKVLNDKELKNCDIVILANKQDLPDAIDPKDLIEKFELDKLSPNHQWKIIPTIATKGNGLPELLDWISNKYDD